MKRNGKEDTGVRGTNLGLRGGREMLLKLPTTYAYSINRILSQLGCWAHANLFGMVRKELLW